MRKIINLAVMMLIGLSLSAQTWETYAAGRSAGTKFVAGKTASGENLYIGRANHNSGLHPGKIQNNRISIGWGGEEVKFNSGEVLTVKPGVTLTWTPRSSYNPAAANALPGGYENGKTLYICRTNYMGNTVPGKIIEGNCNIGWGGNEVVVESNYDILTFSNGFTPEEETEVVIPDDDAVVGLEIGNRAPELNYASPNGTKIALSSLRGQYVLIDFWASWCGPCRGENPNVVANYNKYKNTEFKNGSGFTVYSLSLDNNKTSWTNAIKADKLAWPNHVSDLGGWGSEGADIYEVSGIPTNFLIDGRGIIVATDLRGYELGQALAKFAK